MHNVNLLIDNSGSAHFSQGSASLSKRATKLKVPGLLLAALHSQHTHICQRRCMYTASTHLTAAGVLIGVRIPRVQCALLQPTACRGAPLVDKNCQSAAPLTTAVLLSVPGMRKVQIGLLSLCINLH